jgi:hypothetical protein
MPQPPKRHVPHHAYLNVHTTLTAAAALLPVPPVLPLQLFVTITLHANHPDMACLGTHYCHLAGVPLLLTCILHLTRWHDWTQIRPNSLDRRKHAMLNI